MLNGLISSKVKSTQPISPARRKRNERRLQQALEAHRQGQFDQALANYQRVVDTDPDNALALHHIGLIRHLQGELSDAVQWLKRAGAANPDDSSVHNNLGNMLMEMGRRIEAIAAYQRCLKADPQHRNARFNLAVTLLDERRSEEALDALQWLIEQGVDDASVWNAHGRGLLQLGRCEQAVTSLRRALACAPREAALHANLIDTLIRAFAYEQALEAAVEAKQLFGDDVRIQRAAGGAYLNMTRYQEAEHHLQPVLLAHPNDVEARVWLARALTEQQRAEEAVTLCDEGIAQSGESADLVLARATALIRTDQTEAGYHGPAPRP